VPDALRIRRFELSIQNMNIETRIFYEHESPPLTADEIAFLAEDIEVRIRGGYVCDKVVVDGASVQVEAVCSRLECMGYTYSYARGASGLAFKERASWVS
jgi:hypothetical protein